MQTGLMQKDSMKLSPGGYFLFIKTQKNMYAILSRPTKYIWK